MTSLAAGSVSVAPPVAAPPASAAFGLRIFTGLVVAAAVPLTLSVVFVIMLLTGREFDRITLGALIISLGLLVDDAIIAIEMMVVKLEEGFDRIHAATFAWSSTAAPMLTGTLVTIIGFLPVGFARSGAGEYAGNIFWIVGFALISSWLVAVTCKVVGKVGLTGFWTYQLPVVSSFQSSLICQVALRK